jgi:hypothetical protein
MGSARKSKQADHVTALARTMKARIGPHSEDEPRSSSKEPRNGESGTLASSEANREGPLTPSQHTQHTPDRYPDVAQAPAIQKFCFAERCGVYQE